MDSVREGGQRKERNVKKGGKTGVVASQTI